MGCGGGTFFRLPPPVDPFPMAWDERAEQPGQCLGWLRIITAARAASRCPTRPASTAAGRCRYAAVQPLYERQQGGPPPSTTSALPCPTPGRQKHAPLPIDGQTQLSQPSLCPKPCFGLIGMPRLGCALYYSVPFLVRCNQAQHSFALGLCLSFTLSQPVSLSCRQPSCSDPIAGLVRLSGFNSKAVRAGTDYTSISLFTANWIRLIG